MSEGAGDNLEVQLKKHIANESILLFMKGSPSAPRCGFSAAVVEVLNGFGKAFSYVDVLAHPEVRAALPAISEWPTFPQLFVGGELVGGCDIVRDMEQSGELAELIAEI